MKSAYSPGRVLIQAAASNYDHVSPDDEPGLSKYSNLEMCDDTVLYLLIIEVCNQQGFDIGITNQPHVLAE